MEMQCRDYKSLVSGVWAPYRERYFLNYASALTFQQAVDACALFLRTEEAASEGSCWCLQKIARLSLMRTRTGLKGVLRSVGLFSQERPTLFSD